MLKQQMAPPAQRISVQLGRKSIDCTLRRLLFFAIFCNLSRGKQWIIFLNYILNITNSLQFVIYLVSSRIRSNWYWSLSGSTIWPSDRTSSRLCSACTCSSESTLNTQIDLLNIKSNLDLKDNLKVRSGVLSTLSFPCDLWPNATSACNA